MPSQLQTPFITTLSVLLGAALLTGAYALLSRQHPRHTAEDLHRNAAAKGSEVVEIHRERIPNKVVIITGATSGLGRHTAILLGKAGAHLILAVRNVKEGERVKNEIDLAGPSNIQVWELDLTHFESV
jgi:NADPH:quinone reductase-like Zn-dependent oxidoreductase